MTALLVVEDDAALLGRLEALLRDAGYALRTARSVAEARQQLADVGTPDALLLDVRLGEGPTGVDLVRDLASAGRLPPTVVLSGAATITETVEALRLGVFDFLEKPVGRERLLRSVENAIEHSRLRRRVEDLEGRLDLDREILGPSEAMRALREQVERLAPTDARVLILGETGTGKELVAEQLHRRSRRKSSTFVRVNCAAIPASLIEAELFGHAKGAFTDAGSARAGLFEEADHGTLFLDEIGQLALPLQTRLLRVLEDGLVRRVGETQERLVDVRVIAATNEKLAEAVERGEFRSDLYFRLAHVPLHVPPLRDRREDVPVLFRHFVRVVSLRHGLRPKRVSPPLDEALRAYAWPGNVRELRNLAERLVLLGTDPLTPDQLPADVQRVEGARETGWLRPSRLLGDARTVPLRSFRAECEREYLEAVLQRHGWNVSAAARALGLNRAHLHQKAAELGIARPHGTPETSQDV